MKKRSLVAALAMLMVSAIVLTSSTYAWFAAGTTAKVSGISATIENTDGSISISPYADKGFKPTLMQSDFEAEDLKSTNTFAGEFNPVSFDPATGTFIGGSIMQDTTSPETSPMAGKMIYNPSTNTASSYTKYDVYLKSTTDQWVEVKPEISANVSYIYAHITYTEKAEGSETAVAKSKTFAQDSRSYNPVIMVSDGGSSAPVTGIDANNDKIMTSANDFCDDGTTPYNGVSSTAVTTKAGDVIQIKLTADEAVKFTVYLWAEGNDKSCNAPIANGEIDFGIGFRAINESEVIAS